MSSEPLNEWRRFGRASRNNLEPELEALLGGVLEPYSVRTVSMPNRTNQFDL